LTAVLGVESWHSASRTDPRGHAGQRGGSRRLNRRGSAPSVPCQVHERGRALAAGSLRSDHSWTGIAGEVTLKGTAATDPRGCQQTQLKSAMAVSGIRVRSAASREGGRSRQRAVQSRAERRFRAARMCMGVTRFCGHGGFQLTAVTTLRCLS
jgi:hypothetical protein